MDESATAREIIALETAALDRWGRGDPEGFLALSAPGVSYFDPFQERRLDGFAALKSLYETIRGKIKIDRAEIINPRVQLTDNAAILTIQFASQGSEGSKLWNCTEVYQRLDGQWKIVHSHWSFTSAGLSSLTP